MEDCVTVVSAMIGARRRDGPSRINHVEWWFHWVVVYVTPVRCAFWFRFVQHAFDLEGRRVAFWFRFVHHAFDLEGRRVATE